MKKNFWHNLSWFMITCCFTLGFVACGDDDNDSNGNGGDSPSGSKQELTVDIQNLAGTWQAISAKGKGSSYDYPGGIINVRTLSGLDSLDVPLLMILNTNKTFTAYYPYWNDMNGQYTNSPNFSWRQSGSGLLPNGEGTILLVGKQLQLTDSYGSDYTVTLTIEGLTTKRLTAHYTGYEEEYTITYGRDGDGVDYFSGNSSGGNQNDDNDNPNSAFKASDLIGTWELTHEKGTCYENGVETEQWDEEVKAGEVRIIFNRDGTWQLMESETRETWREDSSGTYYMRGDELAVTGDNIDSFKLLSYSKNEIIVETTSTEEKGYVMVEEHNIYTFKRIS